MKPELLSPCAGDESLRAAILGGADAVYFGGEFFNARMFAKNFDREGICRAIAKCHESGVRAYVTLNTLVSDKNLPQALEYAAFLYESGADALILADLGLSCLIHSNLPDFEMHASTQCSGHNASAAKILQGYGFSRMVCARELSAENIRLLCAESPIEIEMFVHGAICASASGQCLMSSMIGNRSGNRGECAQPCRLPYNNSYPISFKDLCLAGHMKEILRLGVSSLKIEGRMKSPSYIYAVTRAYRRLIDEERDATGGEIERLAAVFSRGGFTDGYFTGSLSGEMLGIRSDSDKKKSEGEHLDFRDSGRRAAPILPPHRTAKIPPPVRLRPEKAGKPSFTARFYRPETVPDTDFFSMIFLPLDRFDPRKAKGVFLPPVVTDREMPLLREKLRLAREGGVEAVLVTNIGQLEFARQCGLRLYGDFRLNPVNGYTASFFGEMEEQIVSPELNLAQCRDLAGKKSVIVYGRIPLMLLEKPVGTSKLRDRRGVSFPVIREGGRDLVLNSVPVYMADRKKELRENGLFRRHFIFTTETKKEVAEILQAYREGLAPEFPCRRMK